MQMPYRSGIYLGLNGPNLETPAEYRMIHLMGADMVGMSTVHEVIVARHMGINVLALSLITNACYPIDRIQKTTVEDVLNVANSKAPIISNIIKKVVEKI